MHSISLSVRKLLQTTCAHGCSHLQQGLMLASVRMGGCPDEVWYDEWAAGLIDKMSCSILNRTGQRQPAHALNVSEPLCFHRLSCAHGCLHLQQSLMLASGRLNGCPDGVWKSALAAGVVDS